MATARPMPPMASLPCSGETACVFGEFTWCSPFRFRKVTWRPCERAVGSEGQLEQGKRREPGEREAGAALDQLQPDPAADLPADEHGEPGDHDESGERADPHGDGVADPGGEARR